jgi:hypothetical protein
MLFLCPIPALVHCIIVLWVQFPHRAFAYCFLNGAIMSTGKSIGACPKCNCAAWTSADTHGNYDLSCMACGYYFSMVDGEGGGFGVGAYIEKGTCITTWFPLDETTTPVFDPEELAQMQWAWLSYLKDGRWEGVAIKGEPRKKNQWVNGLIPLFEELELQWEADS